MMKTNRAVLFIMVVLFTNLLSQDYRLNFEYANRLYLDKKYEEAYEKYQQILEGGLESGQLYYNLGNTAYRLKKKGEAILYYEKALKYMPLDEDVKYNLTLLQMQVVDRLEIPEKPIYLKWFDMLKQAAATPGNEVWIFWGMFILAIFWSGWFYFRKREFANILLTLALLISFIWMIQFGLWNLGNYDREMVTRAVLIENRAEIKAEPNASGETLFILHEGAVFLVLRSSPEWAEIELLDGKKGWIPRRVIGEI